MSTTRDRDASARHRSIPRWVHATTFERAGQKENPADEIFQGRKVAVISEIRVGWLQAMETNKQAGHLARLNDTARWHKPAGYLSGRSQVPQIDGAQSVTRILTCMKCALFDYIGNRAVMHRLRYGPWTCPTCTISSCLMDRPEQAGTPLASRFSCKAHKLLYQNRCC